MGIPAKHYYVDIKLKNKNNISTNVEYVTIPVDNIEYLTIKEHVLSVLPRLEMVIFDAGDLLEAFPLLDKDILSVTISQSKEVDGIDLDFIVSVFYSEADPNDNKFNRIKIAGYLKSELFVPYKNRSFNDNSADVIRKISLESGLVFENPHSVEPNDKMLWYQDCSDFNFIKHVLKRSYVDNDTVFFYGNSKNKMIYTSMNSEMEKESDFTARYDRNRTENFILTDTETDVMYYNAYDVMNLTEMYNNINNYGASYGSYNQKGGEENRTITNSKKFTELKNKYSQYDGKKSSFTNMGLISNPNVFKELNKAIIQNIYFKYNLFSISLSMNINTSTDVKLFDKVNVGLPSTILRGREINDVYSGNYNVTGITHNITYGNQYQKQIVLSRSGINKSELIKQYDIN